MRTRELVTAAKNNLQNDYCIIMQGAPGNGFRQVPNVGQVFISTKDEETARELGDDLLVELSDATAAASNVPQYAIIRFIPREKSSDITTERQSRLLSALANIYEQTNGLPYSPVGIEDFAKQMGWSDSSLKVTQDDLLQHSWIKHFAGGCIFQITHEGVIEAEAYLQDHGRRDELAAKRAQRSTLLKAFYDAAGGSENRQIDLESLAEQYGIVGAQFQSAYFWLLGETLIKQHGAGYHCLLTARGKQRVEESMISKPTMEVFYSYCHTDELLRNELDKHLGILSRQKIITAFHDRKITAGTELHGEIDHYLKKARIILLLISVDFLNSNYCWDVEMKKAMERHESGEARVIPIILRPCDWHDAPFGKLLALPTDGKPVLSQHWHSTDEALVDVARGIKRVIQEMNP